MTEQGATRLERRVVYAGRIVRVEVDRVRLPHNRDVDMEVVRHAGSVVLLPMPDRQHIILIRQYRYAIDRWIWELPAGSLEEGEDPVAGARRECHEEIGLVPETLEHLGTYYPTPGFCDEKMIFFRASGLSKPSEAAARDEDEQIEPRVLELFDVRQMLRRGEIIDMKTAVGLSLIG
jgi:ADP-ribose pyrophosphatase